MRNKHLTEEQQLWWDKLKVYCPDTKEETIGYYAYLNTKHWKLKRIEIFRRDQHKCQKCGKLLNLTDANVHHKTYDHVGKEWNEDLILLCPDCHKAIHGIKVKHKNKDWKSKSFRKKATPKE